MSKFKPCPFCGCRVPPAVQGNGIGDNWLECTECGASTRLREDGAGSEKDWNRRAARATAPIEPLTREQILDLCVEFGQHFINERDSDVWGLMVHLYGLERAAIAAKGKTL